MSETTISDYHDKAAIAERASNGGHRAAIGGLWEEVGRLQFDFMVRHGLVPQHRLLDLGCGSFRGGVHFVPFLEPGNYFGFDRNRSLMDAGYEKEIVPAGLADRLPPENLIADDNFDFSKFPVVFDRVIAVSVFTHLTFNMVRVCLERLAPAVAAGGTFYATYFSVPDDRPVYLPLVHSPGGITTYGYKDPYHYRFSDLQHAVRCLPWEAVDIGDFGHPRDQLMVLFRKRGGLQAATPLK